LLLELAGQLPFLALVVWGWAIGQPSLLNPGARRSHYSDLVRAIAYAFPKQQFRNWPGEDPASRWIFIPLNYHRYRVRLAATAF